MTLFCIFCDWIWYYKVWDRVEFLMNRAELKLSPSSICNLNRSQLIACGTNTLLPSHNWIHHGWYSSVLHTCSSESLSRKFICKTPSLYQSKWEKIGLLFNILLTCVFGNFENLIHFSVTWNPYEGLKRFPLAHGLAEREKYWVSKCPISD